MDKRVSALGKENVRFDGHCINLAATMLEKLSHTIEVVYYLMDRGDERSFVMMLVSANNIDLEALLEREKRKTDILFEIDEIDKETSLYALICQDTKIDGGYHFSERLLDRMQAENAENIYCTDIEIRTSKHEIKFIIFKLIETYVKSKQDGKMNEIVFRSLN